MPIYEYECRKCKARSELIQKMTDNPPTKCSKCGGRLEKMFSAPAIQFKGSGWYVTDYADNGKKAAAKADTETPAKTDTETSTSSTNDDKKSDKKSKETSPSKKTSDKPSPVKSKGD